MKKKILIFSFVFIFIVILVVLLICIALTQSSIKDRTEDVGYYKGVMLPPQGGENLAQVLGEIWKAKQLGANIISIHPEFELGEDGRPKVAELWSQDQRLGDNWRRSLVAMINFSHLIGLKVEIKNASVTGEGIGSIEYKGNPEDYISGYIDATEELAKIAQERNVYQFTIWSEVDQIVLQGRYGKVDIELADDDFDDTIGEWSKRVREAIKEHFNGKVGVGFSGLPDNLAHYKTVEVGRFDYLELSFYGDVYDDYATSNSANAVRTIEEYGKIAKRNGIDKLIVGETALEEAYPKTPLSSTERQQIYREYFQTTKYKVDGFILNSTVSYYNFDDDLRVVGKEHFSSKGK